MNDNDITKALECCRIGGDKCRFDCPYINAGTKNCVDDLLEDAINLINRQKAEIEMLQKENSKGFAKWQILDERTKERYAELYEEAKGVVRAEAIKEFAERLKAVASHLQIGGEYNYQIITINSIDYLVKEMTEAQHDGT